jgi:CMP-N,N'-diacetyllegionaminic acid synthase
LPKNLALIPARCGSKRLPGKNTKLFLGVPLISWTIDLALSSTLIDEVVVSSDCIEVLEIAKQIGGVELHQRSPHTSRDSALMQEVIYEALESLGGERVSTFDYLSILQPTSPLRNLEDLENSYNMLLKDSVADCVISYTQRPPNLGERKEISIGEEGYVTFDQIEETSYSGEPVYIRNGPAICISKLPEARHRLLHGKVLGYEMPFIRSVDIDTHTDFLIAEAIAKSMTKN